MSQRSKEMERILIEHLRTLLRDSWKLYRRQPVPDFDVTLILTKRALDEYDRKNGQRKDAENGVSTTRS